MAVVLVAVVVAEVVVGVVVASVLFFQCRTFTAVSTTYAVCSSAPSIVGCPVFEVCGQCWETWKILSAPLFVRVSWSLSSS